MKQSSYDFLIVLVVLENGKTIDRVSMQGGNDARLFKMHEDREYIMKELKVFVAKLYHINAL